MAGSTRRNYFINKRLQGRLIFGYILFVVSACLCIFVLLIFCTSSSNSVPGVSPSTEPVVIAQVYQSLSDFWPFLAVGTLILLFSAVTVTHRIAGPLFRFEQTLLNMQNGNINDRIQLRPKDEGQELAKQINSFNDQLTKNIRTIHNHSEGIAGLIGNLRNITESFSEEEKEEYSSLLWSLEEKNKKLLAVCEQYKIAKR